MNWPARLAVTAALSANLMMLGTLVYHAFSGEPFPASPEHRIEAGAALALTFMLAVSSICCWRVLTERERQS